MSKPSDKYLDAVVDLYKSFVHKGDIIPLEFNFPAFKVTKGIFNFYAIDALSERAKIGIDSGMYGLQKYSDDINYEELTDYTSRKKTDLTTPNEDKTIGIVIEKILADKIKQDTSMTANEARNGALIGSCVKTMDYKVQELINFEYFKPEIKSVNELSNVAVDFSSELDSNEKIDFVATLITMKELVPQIYRKIIESLDDRTTMFENSINHYTQTNNSQVQKDVEVGIRQNVKMVELITQLKQSANNPDAKILQRALEVDYSLAKNFIDKYPVVMKDILQEGLKKGKTYKM